MTLKWKERNQQSDPLVAGAKIDAHQHIQIERYTSTKNEQEEGASDFIFVVRVNGIMLSARPFIELEDAKAAGEKALIASINIAHAALQKET
jgi:hypothetical protein